MPASEARILANRANALKATGPRTPEGKLASRSNALTHGLTGAGVVLPASDAAEVERKAREFGSELGAQGQVGRLLAHRLAVLAVRIERSARHERAAIAANVRRALDEFEPPEGVTDPAEVAVLRARAGDLALFDPSPEATLARKYEAAAERGFFKALREIRELRDRATAPAPAEPAAERAEAEVAQVAARARAAIGALGSFFPATNPAPKAPTPAQPAPSKPAPSLPDRPQPASIPSLGAFDVPISIGLAR